jgi:O-6-methylguanine DNA methyltransferase
MNSIKTRFGTLGFEVSPNGLTRVLLPCRSASGGGAPLTTVEKRVAAALTRYCDGRLKQFGLPLDFGKSSRFTRRVLDVCARIPFGEVITYGELARRAGRPRAARAVGRVMATNPLPIVVPCHRVVASDGSLHGYGGGLEMKKRLLKLEGVEVSGSGQSARVMNFSKRATK